MSCKLAYTLVPAVLASLLVIQVSRAQPEQPSIRIVPPNIQVAPGTVFSATVKIESAQNLGGYEFDLVYDPGIIEVTSVTPGPFLKSTGRQLVFLGPVIDSKAGRTGFGAVSFGRPPGASGDGVLATLQLKARAEGATTLQIEPSGLVYDTAAAPHAPARSGATVVVGLHTVTPAASRTPTQTPQPPPARTPSPTLTLVLPSPTASPVPPAQSTPGPATSSLSLSPPAPMTPTLAPAISTAVTASDNFGITEVLIIVIAALTAAGFGYWAGRRARAKR